MTRHLLPLGAQFDMAAGIVASRKPGADFDKRNAAAAYGSAHNGVDKIVMDPAGAAAFAAEHDDRYFYNLSADGVWSRGPSIPASITNASADSWQNKYGIYRYYYDWNTGDYTAKIKLCGKTAYLRYEEGDNSEKLSVLDENYEELWSVTTVEGMYARMFSPTLDYNGDALTVRVSKLLAHIYDDESASMPIHGVRLDFYDPEVDEGERPKPVIEHMPYGWRWVAGGYGYYDNDTAIPHVDDLVFPLESNTSTRAYKLSSTLYAEPGNESTLDGYIFDILTFGDDAVDKEDCVVDHQVELSLLSLPWLAVLNGNNCYPGQLLAYKRKAWDSVTRLYRSVTLTPRQGVRYTFSWNQTPLGWRLVPRILFDDDVVVELNIGKIRVDAYSEAAVRVEEVKFNVQGANLGAEAQTHDFSYTRKQRLARLTDARYRGPGISYNDNRDISAKSIDDDVINSGYNDIYKLWSGISYAEDGGDYVGLYDKFSLGVSGNYYVLFARAELFDDSFPAVGGSFETYANDDVYNGVAILESAFWGMLDGIKYVWYQYDNYTPGVDDPSSVYRSDLCPDAAKGAIYYNERDALAYKDGNGVLYVGGVAVPEEELPASAYSRSLYARANWRYKVFLLLGTSSAGVRTIWLLRLKEVEGQQVLDIQEVGFPKDITDRDLANYHPAP